MRKIVSSVGFLSKFGRCRFCARKAFLAAALACGAAVLVMIFTKAPSLRLFAGTLAIGSTLLWLTHLLMFAGRASGQFAAAHSAEALAPRRSVLLMFVKVLATAAVASAIPEAALACVGQFGACERDDDCCSGFFCFELNRGETVCVGTSG